VGFGARPVDGDDVSGPPEPPKGCGARGNEPIKGEDAGNPVQKLRSHIGLTADDVGEDKPLIPSLLKELNDLFVAKFWDTRLRPPVAIATNRTPIGDIEAEDVWTPAGEMTLCHREEHRQIVP
jgi:hypothetical protein